MDNEEKVRAKFVRSICSPIIVLLLSIPYRFVAYSESRAGNPMFGAEDMGCFIQLLVGNGKISKEEAMPLLNSLFHSNSLEVGRQSEEMGRLIEETKEKIKKENLTPEQCQKMLEDEKGVLKSYLLMRAVYELQKEGQ